MKYLNILYCLLAAGLLLQCSKKSSSGNDLLPTQPVTCENAQGNCFRCELNGEEWVAQTPGSIGGPMAHYVEYTPQNDEVYIEVVREIPSENKFESMKLYIADIRFGIPHLKLGNGQAHAYSDLNQNSPCSYAYYNPNIPCSLELLDNDTINNIIEAKFELTFYNSACGADSIIPVHNGHFRLHY